MFEEYSEAMRARILIVEDEPDLANLLSLNLRREHYEAWVVQTGRAGLDRARETPAPDLILLDRMLPDLSGDEVLQRLRSDPATWWIPIVFVTARDAEDDRVEGLSLGADDYVVKPFSVRELILRVTAILRRTDPAEAGLVLDPDGHCVRLGGQSAILTPLEYGVLEALSPGRVLSRTEIVDQVWPEPLDVTLSVVDAQVKRLRGKLEQLGWTIRSVRGVGYRLEPAAAQARASG